ncbi:MAG: zinc transporter ZupT [Candidatus Cloacimonetes bacterium]|nr:zinc transporter ZupT [Candidatus Cloacimonadota bacterium]
MDDKVLFALGLTVFAGLSTGIGSALAFFARRTDTKFLSLALGFSAGVMIYVSMIEIFVKAKDSLTAIYGLRTGYWLTVLAFFMGILMIALIDKLIPSFENPHEMHKVEELNKTPDFGELKRMGLLSALAIAIHNFPEGFATFASALSDTKLGISIAVAIAIHNIPEGIAVSVPLFYATGSKKKAFLWSFLSGLSEPVGALVGFLLLSSLVDLEKFFGIPFAMVAGIMVFISFDELLPAAEKFGHHHLTIYGLVAGMLLMALSLLMFV